MREKPRGLSPDYARQFCDASIVQAYHHRPRYPAELFAILRELSVDRPRAVLDIGCGRGEVARNVLAWVDRVDAIDASPAMIETGKRLPGGEDPRLRWICSTVEAVEAADLSPPYALVTAGSSLHWMDWEIVMPRLVEVLSPRGVLAVFDDQTLAPSWVGGLGSLIPKFSTNRDFRPYQLIDELVERRLFRVIGSKQTAAVPFEQSIDEYIESFHSRNGFSRQRMPPESAAAFDSAVRELVRPYAREDGMIELQLLSTVTWGKPIGGKPIGGKPIGV